MKHDEIRKAVNECIKNYFKEDLEVLLDESVLRLKGGIFYIYDLIFFGNKIILFEETLETIRKSANAMFSSNLSKNCKYLLENMENDKFGNYYIISDNEYGSNKIQKISNFLKENKKVVYLLESTRLYYKIVKDGLEERVKLITVSNKIVCVCKNRSVRFETLGFVFHKDGKMFLKDSKDNMLIKVYTELGEEKNNNVGVGDIILLKADKQMKYSFHIYEIITNHTRHFAVQIIWTELMKGEKTNFYVERLEHKYKKIIKDNA